MQVSEFLINLAFDLAIFRMYILEEGTGEVLLALLDSNFPFFPRVASLLLLTLNLKSTELGYFLFPSLVSMVLMLEARDIFFLKSVFNFR